MLTFFTCLQRHVQSDAVAHSVVSHAHYVFLLLASILRGYVQSHVKCVICRHGGLQTTALASNPGHQYFSMHGVLCASWRHDV